MKSPSNKSNTSFVSGGTLYKLKKVSHSEKIKLLEKELEEYKLYSEEVRRKEMEVNDSIKEYILKFDELEKKAINAEKELSIYKIDAEEEKERNKKEMQSSAIQTKI